MAEDEIPAPEPIAFGTADKVLAAVLLLGVLGVAYICLDVMAGGRITRTLSRGPE